MMKPKTINEYLAPLSDEKRVALQKLRRTIKAAAPGAKECISYGLPAFCLDGKAFIWFGAAAKHCALYGPVDPAYKAELADFDTNKGTIRFKPEKPLPAALVRKLVKSRIAKRRQ